MLDEPANGLDPEGIQWLRGFLRHLAHEQGRTVLVSSHLLSEVEQTVDRVVIVGAGRLVREGVDRAAALGRRRRRHGAGPQPRGRTGSPRCCAPTGRSVDGGGRRRADRHRLRTPAEVGRQAFAAGIELHELRSQTSGLEEIYFQLTGGPGAVRRSAAGPPSSQEAPR